MYVYTKVTRLGYKTRWWFGIIVEISYFQFLCRNTVNLKYRIVTSMVYSRYVSSIGHIVKGRRLANSDIFWTKLRKWVFHI